MIKEVSLNSIITHQVKGGSVIPNIVIYLTREFIIKEDNLLIDDPFFIWEKEF